MDTRKLGEFAAKDSIVTLGHEFSGEVAECGEMAKNRFKVGDRVIVDPNSYCYSCDWCFKGLFNHCINGALRTTVGIRRDGGWATYCLVPQEICHVMDDGMDFDQGALVEPLACIYHGWERMRKFGAPQPDSRIFILGAGIIGNLWTCMFHYHGFKDVTVTEPLDARRDIAKILNQETGYRVLSPHEAEAELPPTQKEMELSGVDIIVDCTGSAEAFQTGVRWLRRGGAMCVFGCTPPGEKAQLYPQEVFVKELAIFGTQIAPLTCSRSVALAAKMGGKYLSLEKLGVELFEMKDYEKALNKLEAGSISKAMFRL